MTSETLANIIESIVFVSGNQIAACDIAEKLEVSEKEVLKAAEILKNKYTQPCGINFLVFNKKLQFCSNPQYAESVSSVLNPIRERELSRSMLEVAAIIAYKQPVTRLDLEEIRGVDSEYAIQNLLKLGVIEIVGRKDAVGRPALFGTTDVFLKRFQISALSELPEYESLISQIKADKKDDDYLFRKDEYDASKDPELLAAQGKTLPEDNGKTAQSDESSAKLGGVNVFAETAAVDGANAKSSDDDFDIGDMSDEDIPDFLKDEEYTKIG